MAYITITELPEKNDFPIDNPWFIISTEDTSYKVQFQAIFNTVTNATNNYTDTNIASILDGAPADLDTLNKLAAALNDNPTFAADVLAQIAALTTDDIAEGSNLYYTEDRVNTNFAAKSTTDLVEGSNLYYTEGRVNANFNSKSTTDLTEGLNLYFTNERVDDRVANLLQPGTNISLSYNDTAGTLTINSSNVGGYDLSANTTSDLAEGTNLYFTDLRATSNFTANLALSTTDDLTEGSNLYFTDQRFDDKLVTKTTDDLVEGIGNLYYTDARAQAAITGGTGIDVTAGVVSLPQAVSPTSNVIFNDVTVSGNLDVQGSITTLNTVELEVTDNNITLNSGTGDTSGSADTAGITIQDAVSAGVDASFFWDQTNTRWVLSHDLQTNLVGNVTGNVTGNLTGNVTGNVTGQVSDISNHNTSALSEGTNLYYTDARVATYIGTTNTDALAEGSTNLYFQDSRARASISAGKGMSYDSGTGVVSANNSVYVSATEPMDWVVGDVWIETA